MAAMSHQEMAIIGKLKEVYDGAHATKISIEHHDYTTARLRIQLMTAHLNDIEQGLINLEEKS